MEAIARNVKKWQPVFQPKQEENGTGHPTLDTSVDLLSFETFNIKKVCDRSAETWCASYKDVGVEGEGEGGVHHMECVACVV